MLVHVTLFLLLYKRNISLYYALSVVYLAGKLYSLLLTKCFISVYRRLKGSLVLGSIRLKPLKELEGAYLDTLVV